MHKEITLDRTTYKEYWKAWRHNTTLFEREDILSIHWTAKGYWQNRNILFPSFVLTHILNP